MTAALVTMSATRVTILATTAKATALPATMAAAPAAPANDNDDSDGRASSSSVSNRYNDDNARHNYSYTASGLAINYATRPTIMATPATHLATRPQHQLQFQLPQLQ